MSKERTYKINFNKNDRKLFFKILYYACLIAIVINLGVIIHTLSWLWYDMVGFDPYIFYIGYYYGLPYIISAFAHLFASSLLIVILIFLMRYSRERAGVQGIWEDLKQFKKELIDE
jgi:hypothetical protein